MVAVDAPRMTDRVREREEIVLEFFRNGAEHGLQGSKKVNELGEAHVF